MISSASRRKSRWSNVGAEHDTSRWKPMSAARSKKRLLISNLLASHEGTEKTKSTVDTGELTVNHKESGVNVRELGVDVTDHQDGNENQVSFGKNQE